MLNHPKFPDWPGLDRFEGVKFHSARWPSDVDLTGQRVAVVGTGSTGGQLVPAIAADVAHLYVFQRQPGWLRPKMERDLTPRSAPPCSSRFDAGSCGSSSGGTTRRRSGPGPRAAPSNRTAREVCVDYIETVLADRPDLIKMVTPDYPFGGKRVVQDSNFYPALMRDNVELIPHAVTEVTPHGVIDDTGTEREIDVLVMCTGFQPARFLATYDVVGRDGRSDLTRPGWGPSCLPGPDRRRLPELLHAVGPQYQLRTGHVPARAAGRVRDRQRQAHDAGGVTAIEVKPWVLDLFNWIVQKRLAAGRRRPAPGGPQLRTVRLGTQRHPVARGDAGLQPAHPHYPTAHFPGPLPSTGSSPNDSRVRAERHHVVGRDVLGTP